MTAPLDSLWTGAEYWVEDLRAPDQKWRRKPILVGPPGRALAAGAGEAAWVEWRLPCSQFTVAVLEKGVPRPRAVRVQVSSHWPSVRAELSGPAERDLDEAEIRRALDLCATRGLEAWFEIPLRVENAFYIPQTAAWIRALGGERVRVTLSEIDAKDGFSDAIRHFRPTWLEDLAARVAEEAPGLTLRFAFPLPGRRSDAAAVGGPDAAPAAQPPEPKAWDAAREPPSGLVVGFCRTAGELHVGEDGAFYPCERLRGTPHRLGMAGVDAVLDVWNGECLRARRRGFLAGNPPDPCRICGCRTAPPPAVPDSLGRDAAAHDAREIDLDKPVHLAAATVPPCFRWNAPAGERRQHVVLMPRGRSGPEIRVRVPKGTREWTPPATIWDSLEPGLLHWWTVEQESGGILFRRKGRGELRAFLRRRTEPSG